MKYPNVLYTTFLSAFLLVPFAIRLRFTEPYPAVLLPSGATRIKATGDQIQCDRTAIYGRLAGRDAWIRLSPPQFLYPIPIEFFLPLAQRYFGLSPSAHRILKVGSIAIDTQPKISEEEVDSAKQWLRARLTASGCEDNVLRITQEAVSARRADGAELAVRCQDEKIVDLR